MCVGMGDTLSYTTPCEKPKEVKGTLSCGRAPWASHRHCHWLKGAHRYCHWLKGAHQHSHWSCVRTLVIGATVGMTTVTGTPSCGPCHASASAWFPADAAITPLLRASGESERIAFLPPRSLKLPVNCGAAEGPGVSSSRQQALSRSRSQHHLQLLGLEVDVASRFLG